MISNVEAYNELLEISKYASMLGSIEEVLVWDSRTYLPKDASSYRADQIALIAGMVHEKKTDPRVGELLSELDEDDKNAEEYSVHAVNIREWKRDYDKQIKLPKEFVEEKSRTAIKAQAAWQEARKSDNFGIFKPWLEKTVDLSRRTAEYLGYENEMYDVLLDIYEPGALTVDVAGTLAQLRDELVPLVHSIASSQNKPYVSILKRGFSQTAQRSFAVEIAAAINYDFNKGRLDETAHPFCIGLGPDDTRITTRFDERWLPGALFGVIHEAGHGIYDQNLPDEHYGTPMGEYVSLGIHESQSRLWENMVGRSRAFWEHWYPKAREYFPVLQDVILDDFYFAINRVEPSLIRVEADEVTYNMHIMIRFELERAMLNGDLVAADLPGAWNEKYKEYLGIDVPNDANGCLQDIHWSGGMIGYFPTYSLGNLNAAQLFKKAEEELGDMDEMFRKGEFQPLKSWLTEKIHSQGRKYQANKLIEVATGESLNASALVEYLKAKYMPLYGL